MTAMIRYMFQSNNFSSNNALLVFLLRKKRLATLVGRAPEFCVRALCPDLILLLSSGRAGQPCVLLLSSFCFCSCLPLAPIVLLLSPCCLFVGVQMTAWQHEGVTSPSAIKGSSARKQLQMRKPRGAWWGCTNVYSLCVFVLFSLPHCLILLSFVVLLCPPLVFLLSCCCPIVYVVFRLFDY